jgi:hypothetical protein
LAGKPEGRTPIEIPGRRRKDNIKSDLKGVGAEGRIIMK